MNENEENLIELTADIVSAYVSHNTIVAENIPNFIASVHAALCASSAHGGVQPKVELVPAVSIKKSVTPEHIICLEDGKKFKSLKRHLRTRYDLSPEQYREKWGLAHDYPMVAPMYAAARSELAKTMGLGQRRQGGKRRRRQGVGGRSQARSRRRGAQLESGVRDGAERAGLAATLGPAANRCSELSSACGRLLSVFPLTRRPPWQNIRRWRRPIPRAPQGGPS